MAIVFVRVNHVGWAHVWATQAEYDGGEPSLLFFNTKNDPRWPSLLIGLSLAQRQDLSSGKLVELDDQGLWSHDLGVD